MTLGLWTMETQFGNGITKSSKVSLLILLQVWISSFARAVDDWFGSLSRTCFRTLHRLSMGFKSGLFPGHISLGSCPGATAVSWVPSGAWLHPAENPSLTPDSLALSAFIDDNLSSSAHCDSLLSKYFCRIWSNFSVLLSEQDQKGWAWYRGGLSSPV